MSKQLSESPRSMQKNQKPRDPAMVQTLSAEYGARVAAKTNPRDRITAIAEISKAARDSRALDQVRAARIALDEPIATSRSHLGTTKDGFRLGELSRALDELSTVERPDLARLEGELADADQAMRMFAGEVEALRKEVAADPSSTHSSADYPDGEHPAA